MGFHRIGVGIHHSPAPEAPAVEEPPKKEPGAEGYITVEVLDPKWTPETPVKQEKPKKQ